MTTNTEIPPKMKRLVVQKPGKDVKSCQIGVEEVDTPHPAPHQVLIKVSAAAVNPSDYGSWTRLKPEECPAPIGNEGCGVVVKTGEGLIGAITSKVPYLIGSKVGFIQLQNNQGAYSEYVVADVLGQVFPIPKELPVEDAASFFVNPFTVLAILDTVKKSGSKAFVHTAAASHLGQMMVEHAPSEGIEVINVVHREEQAELLKNLGAKHVIASGSDNTWKGELGAKMEELNANLAFDAVGGRLSGDLLDVLPQNGTLYVYGGLAGKLKNIDPYALIYRKIKVKGFALNDWIEEGGLTTRVPRIISAVTAVTSGLLHGWSSSKFKDTTMNDLHTDLMELLKSGTTGSKLRVRFDT